MNTLKQIQNRARDLRRGTIIVLAAISLSVCGMFVAFSVDLGMVSLERTRMQNAVDAAALAAAMEISAAVEQAGPNVADVTAFAREAARTKAAEVAAMNGVYVDPATDVYFGKRSYNAATGTFEVTWDAQQANVVKVVARRDNDDPAAPDAKLKLMFAGVVGDKKSTIRAEASAYVESRDIVAVLDFSRSMNFDSYFNSTSMGRLTDTQIEDNLRMVFDDLQPVNTGSMGFDPNYLSLTKSEGDTDVTVTFEYDQVLVESTDPLVEVKLEFDSGSRQTFAASGESGVFSGTGWNSNDDIVEVWVTVRSGSGSPVTLTGKRPRKNCEPQVEVTFSGDRLSVDVSSSKDLSNVVLRFTNGVEYKFDNLNVGRTATFTGVGSHTGLEIERVWVKSGCNKSGDGPGYGERFIAPESSSSLVELTFEDTNDNVEKCFGLDTISYPYPGGSWNSFINYARGNSSLRDAGYREMYGGLTLVNYILEQESGYWETPDLWRTRHYPFHAVKEGQLLLCDFLDELGFDDYLGFVSYDTYHRVETTLSGEGMPSIDISANPITNDYAAIRDLMYYKQAAHYAYATNIGGGMMDAQQLIEDHSRNGARKTMIVMTDGNSNTIDPGESTSLPYGWDWNKLLDYDGDGSYDYYTGNGHKRYVLKKAYEAYQAGITIHTMSVGADADRDLMRAVAHIGNGHWINVPGGTTVSEMESEVREAFNRIAAFVPPARLLPNE